MNGDREEGHRRLEKVIGAVLRFGTIASSTLFAAGVLMALAGVGGGIAPMLLTGGLLLLLATPVARVTVSLVEFARERDWVFVVLTLAVLLALGMSVLAAYR